LTGTGYVSPASFTVPASVPYASSTPDVRGLGGLGRSIVGRPVVVSPSDKTTMPDGGSTRLALPPGVV